MIQEVRNLISAWAEEFGAKVDNEFSNSFIERKNIDNDVLDDKGAYFGFIHPEEEKSGPYHDYSFVIFPTSQEKPWLVTFCVGSSNFKRDFELASKPGLRRLFSKLINEDGYCSTDLTNINNSLPKSFTSNPKIQHLSRTISIYSRVINCCQIVENPLDNDGQQIIKAFLAAYAKVRNWPTNQNHRNAISNAL
ncbi:MAG: ATPase, partial [Cyclobacteriaceae bacterium]|nr:ATPase [Cyclobacteriaceae bacterium]